MVIDWNLCPFAKRELLREKVRFVVSGAQCEEDLLLDLHQEWELLHRQADIETTLLIHPEVLGDFEDYNQFLNSAEGLLSDLGWEGVFQLASFHPQYQFAGSRPDDPENYTNRSPVQLLHILRESSLEKAIDRYPEVDSIPAKNIELMNRLGLDTLRNTLKKCSDLLERTE